MKSALLKDVLREIKGSKSRFFSIFAIIALGAGFFAGLKVTCPDMMFSQNKYVTEQNLMDIRLVSTYGFSEEDVSAIAETEGIRDLYPSYSKDVFVEDSAGSGIIAKLMAYPDSGVNTPVLLEGRLPEKAGECVAENNSQVPVNYKIGDTIKIYTTDPEDPIGDSVINTEFEVVGIAMSPQYVAFDRGTAVIGDGSADMFVMVPEENFCMEVYTEVYITLDSTYGVYAFSEEYESAVEIASEDFEKVAESREKLRLDEIKKDAFDEINEAKEEISKAEKELADAGKELEEAFEELSDGEKELSDGRREYYSGLKEFEDGKILFEQEIADAEKQLLDGEKMISEGWEEYQKGLEEYERGLAEFEAGLEEQGMTVSELYLTRDLLEVMLGIMSIIPGIDDQIAEMESQLAQLETAIDGYEQLSAAEETLAEAKKELVSSEKELEEGREELEKEKIRAEEEFIKAERELLDAAYEIKDAEQKISDGWSDYYEGLAEFEEEKAEAETELGDAKNDIADAEKELDELKEPEWYVFTRNDNPKYSSFESSAAIVDNVGKAFPIFFFLVAMLVCLTTMTRMVEEKRTETGTLKALGYGGGSAILKYIVYAAFASIFGSVFGIAVCVFVFPVIIYYAYGMMFILPELQFVPMFGTWAAAVAVCILCTTLAVVIVGYSELRENPAELMRPKPPKNGKRVLLERIPFIWKKLSFNRKVTVRNLFRYKKRIFMTILGIAGCTALTLTGFGIYSTLSVILEKQYQEIFNYDVIISLDRNAGEKSIAEIYEETENSDLIENSFSAYVMSAEHKRIGNTNLICIDDNESFAEFIHLRDYETGEKIAADNEGIIVTQRFAQIFGYSAGDVITFSCDGKEFTAEISAVSEHYAMHFIYISEELYEELSGEIPEKNAIFGAMTDESKENRSALAETLIGKEGVMAVSFSKDDMDEFDKTISNLNYVVVLIIFCAAALAFIVLYNLTNVNIMERIREIATIKVLGFYNAEVDSYVFRENIILSLLGAAVGLFLGEKLYIFVLGSIQSDELLFIENLTWWCYAGAFALTILFTFAVNGIMHFTLKKISMVESLKSVE